MEEQKEESAKEEKLKKKWLRSKGKNETSTLERVMKKKRLKQFVGSLALMGACLTYSMVSSAHSDVPPVPGFGSWQFLAGN